MEPVGKEPNQTSSPFILITSPHFVRNASISFQAHTLIRVIIDSDVRPSNETKLSKSIKMQSITLASLVFLNNNNNKRTLFFLNSVHNELMIVLRYQFSSEVINKIIQEKKQNKANIKRKKGTIV